MAKTIESPLTNTVFAMPYQRWPKQMPVPRYPIQAVSLKNVSSLANASSLGYYSGWQGANQQARSWLTTDGHPKLDIVIFTYHHALGPLVDEEALRKEIQIYKELYPNIWGSGISVGFFPAELSFSERMIKVLVEEGIEWVFVPNEHVSRACDNFPATYGTGGLM